MKTRTKYLSAAIAMAAVFALFLVLRAAGPALSTATLGALVAPVAAATPLPGDAIPVKPITGLDSLDATVTLNVNGLIDGQRAQGDLTGLLAANEQGKSKITVSGSLLGDIAAQVGGSLVGMFTPSKVDLYKVPSGTYVAVGGLFPMCVKPNAAKATKSLDDMSPSSLLSMLTSSDVARGRFVGEETLNGVPVKHYVLDGEAFLAAAQNSDDPQLKAFGEALWSAEDADLYLDARTGYPLAFRGSFSGEFEPLKFEGDFDVFIELTGLNTNTPVVLPSSCNKPISK